MKSQGKAVGSKGMTAWLISIAAICLSAASAFAAGWGQYDVTGGVVYFLNSESNVKFKYMTGTAQWWHYSPAGSAWYELGLPGLSSAFIGDGKYHDLGNGFSYAYGPGSDSGWFVKGGTASRYSYYYSPGQWYSSGNNGGWKPLGNAGLSAGFLGDSAWHDLGNGFSFLYNSGLDLGWFKKASGVGRFGYYYTTGKWLTTGNYGGWQYAGNAGLSASFLGDSAWHDLGNGFSYLYNSSADLGWFKKVSGMGRFGYFHTQSRWLTTGNYGGWQYIGNAGLSASFLGDGAWHELGGVFSYLYNSSADVGWFRRDGIGRFGYAYNPGRWMTTGDTGGWQYIGEDRLSASFLGDGATHDLGSWNGRWFFSYDAGTGLSDDRARFSLSVSGNDRFAFAYHARQWLHYGSSWESLGGTAADLASFIGNGSPHDLGNGWWFTYNSGSGYADDEAGYGLDAAPSTYRFVYAYNDRQWFHCGPDAIAHWLTAYGTAAGVRFVGEYSSGERLNLGGGWSYWYDGGTGYWHNGVGTRFHYAYASGQWSHYSDTENTLLGPEGLSADFIGTSAWRDITASGHNPWYYSYNIATDRGQWSRDGSDAGIRFSYNYDAAGLRWYHHRSTASWGTLGPVGTALAEFLGEDSWHDVSTAYTWYYTYNYGDDTGYWYRDVGPSYLRFYYAYGSGAHSPGTWYRVGYLGSEDILGAAELDAGFVGEGDSTRRFVDRNGRAWWYVYQYGIDTENWYRHDTANGARLAYGNTEGWWFYMDRDGNSSSFAYYRPNKLLVYEEDEWTTVENGFEFSYNWSQDTGYWKLTFGGALRFRYLYANSRWEHKGSIGSWTRLSDDGTRGDLFVGRNIGAPTYITYAGNAWRYYFDSGSGFWLQPDSAYLPRFAYDYTTGYWSHYGPVGDWDLLSDAGLATDSRFIEDYAVDDRLNLLNGFSYHYDYELDAGYWFRTDVSANLRFIYYYRAGAWDTQGDYGAANTVGTSASPHMGFVGMGSYQDFETYNGTWGYYYDYGLDLSVWASLTYGSYTQRFSYDHNAGQWYHHSSNGGDASIGSAESDSRFHPGFSLDMATWWPILVDGHTWYMGYDYLTDIGFWAIGASSSDTRFSYGYFGGQWYRQRGLGPAYEIGHAAWNPGDFIGDGQRWYATLPGGDVWWFRYEWMDGDSGRDIWYLDSFDDSIRFDYDYSNFQWRHWRSAGEFAVLGTGNGDSLFIGNGNVNPITYDGREWYYWYEHGTSTGKWARSSTGEDGLRFSYDYSGNRWYQHQGALSYSPLGLQDLEFVGDGQRRYVSDPSYYGLQMWSDWDYEYDYFSDSGIWFKDAGNPEALRRFSYKYGFGYWVHYNQEGSAFPEYLDLMGSASLTYFIADGARRSIDYYGSQWYYQYYATHDGEWNEQGRWFRADLESGLRMKYYYQDHVWKYSDLSSTEFTIASVYDVELPSVARNQWYVIEYDTLPAGHFSYAYDYANDVGAWGLTSTHQRRFGYGNIVGAWYLWEQNSVWKQLGSSGQSGTFVGDGNTYGLWTGTDLSFRYSYESDQETFYHALAQDTFPYLFVGYSFGGAFWYDSYDRPTDGQEWRQMVNYWLSGWLSGTDPRSGVAGFGATFVRSDVDPDVEMQLWWMNSAPGELSGYYRKVGDAYFKYCFSYNRSFLYWRYNELYPSGSQWPFLVYGDADDYRPSNNWPWE